MGAMLTVAEAAEKAGISSALVYGWIAAGLLAHHRLGLPGKRGCIRIAEADLDAFLAGRRREGRQEGAPLPAARPPAARMTSSAFVFLPPS
jgi:excisionase family DNA binding protein